MLHLPHTDFNSGFTSQELNLPFKEIIRIYLKECPGKGDKHNPMGLYLYPNFIGGHTHTCVDDPYYGCVCITHKGLLQETDGSIGAIIWHEYGHIMDVTTHFIGCYEHEEMSNAHIQDIGHGETFKKIMANLGKPEYSARNLSANILQIN